jgi:predicted DNA-binding transcriptional regulator AlpA
MAEAAKKLFTLTEVSNKTNISMPTLQRYKKLYQSRIPSQGAGRSQRYPADALDVFLELKKENIGKRGRPRKNAAAAPKPAAPKKRGAKPAAPQKAAAKPAEGLLTLTQIASMTGISYPTLLRYVKTNLKQIPHKGTGRARRFLPEAVGVFKTLREQSKRGRKAGSTSKKAAAAAAAPKATGRKPGRPAGRRGRPPGRPKAEVDNGDLLDRIKQLEKSQKQLEKLIARQEKLINKPYKVTLQR